VRLTEFLNGRSIANLQTLQWLWASATPRSSSKSELLRLLRQSMLSPERVRQCFQALEATQQEFLRALLRLDSYESDVELLFRRVVTPPATAQIEQEILEELSRRGFISTATVRPPNQAEALRATVPQELGDTLADVLNLDIREPGIMLSLRQHLGGEKGTGVFSLEGPPEPGPSEARAAPQKRLPSPFPALAQPDAIEQRIAALPDAAMQRAVRLALDDHAGILPLERFPSLGLDIEPADSPRWREALEAACLGTFGHLSLLEYGVGDDHDCLVLFQEIVEAHAAARGAQRPPLDHVYACGIDFLTDLITALDFLRANPSKLTAAGRFFKGARNQLLPQTGLRTTFFMDEESLLGFKLTVARYLDLAEPRDDGRLHVTRAALDWESLPLVAQARSLLDSLLGLGEAACSPAQFQALAATAREVLLDSEPGVWYPTHAFIARIVSRHLMALLHHGPPQEAEPARGEEAMWRYPRALGTVAAIVAAAREPLLQALNAAGVLDIGRCGDHSFVAATALAPVVLGDAQLPAPTAPLLLVNPDFEVALFPDPGHLQLLHRLSAFCEREKSEVTLHLRITKESVQRAVLRGLTPESILAALTQHSRAPLSQNIEYSIRNWAAGVFPAEIRTLHVLELPSAEALDAALSLPQIAPLVVRRLSPTVAALRVPQLDPESEDALKQLGIYLM